MWPWNVPSTSALKSIKSTNKKTKTGAQKSAPGTITPKANVSLAETAVVGILPKTSSSNASEKSHKISSTENNKSNNNSKNNKRNHNADTSNSITTKRNRTNANNNNNSNNTVNVDNKIDGETELNNKSDSKLRTSIKTIKATLNATVTSTINNSCNNSNATNVRSQTKITGFFKTQVKALPSLKKDLTNMVIRSTEFPSSNGTQQQTINNTKDDSKILSQSISPIQSMPCIPDKTDATLPNVQNNHNNNNSNSLSVDSKNSERRLEKFRMETRFAPSTVTNAKKVERKTAKVSPISRKSNAMKKSYANVLPKKHVNIAPRTNTTSITMPSMALTTMADSIKSQQSKSQQQQRLHVKVFRRQTEYGNTAVRASNSIAFLASLKLDQFFGFRISFHSFILIYR